MTSTVVIELEAAAASRRLPHRSCTWEGIRAEARSMLRREPSLAGLLTAGVLIWPTLPMAISHRLASRLGDSVLPTSMLGQVFDQLYSADPALSTAAYDDLERFTGASDGSENLAEVVLFSNAYLGAQARRLAGRLWHQDRRDLALQIQSRVSAVFGIDGHPSQAASSENRRRRPQLRPA